MYKDNKIINCFFMHTSAVFFCISSIATSIGLKTICFLATTRILVFKYGKCVATVRIVLRLHCSLNSP